MYQCLTGTWCAARLGVVRHGPFIPKRLPASDRQAPFCRWVTWLGARAMQQSASIILAPADQIIDMARASGVTINLFGWLVLVVNDRKFSIKTVFFSHTKPANNTSSRTRERAQPGEQAAAARSDPVHYQPLRAP